jgi:hypothetical protein
MLLIDWCARESEPGEIWAVNGIEIEKILSTMHPRSIGFARAPTLFARRVFKIAMIGST